MKYYTASMVENTELLDLGFSDEIVGLENGLFSSLKLKLNETASEISNKINTRTHGFREFLYERGSLASVKKITDFDRKAKKIIDTKEYSDMSMIQLPAVHGLTTDLYTLTEKLSPYFTNLKKNSMKNLEEMDDVISNFIGDKEFRKSFKVSKTSFEEINEKFNIKLDKDLKSMFSTKDKSEFVSLGKLVRSNNELKGTLKNIIYINDNFTDKDLIKLNKKIDSIQKKIEMLVKMLNIDEVEASKEAIQGVVTALSTVANYVSSVSNLYYVHMTAMDVMLKIKEVYEK